MQERIHERRLASAPHVVERRTSVSHVEACLNATMVLCRMALEDCRAARLRHDLPSAKRCLQKAKAYREILLHGWPW